MVAGQGPSRAAPSCPTAPSGRGSVKVSTRPLNPPPSRDQRERSLLPAAFNPITQWRKEGVLAYTLQDADDRL
jgi:hypothetical protein